ncbi:MAG: TrmH family RNA methyltransferase, partial [Spirochaetaceae bacterium]
VGPVVFALETGGRPLEEFAFPPSGVVLIGNEELGLSREARALAGDRVCTIPMAGAKGSLNVAVAVGILLHAWWSRMQNPPR